MEPFEFRPSLGFVALGAMSPVLLLLLGGWGLIRAGELRAFPLVLIVLGLGLALVAAFDVPHRIVLDENGVQRQCLLRRRLFPWDDVVAFRRPQPRKGRRGVGRGPTQSGAGGAPASGKGGLLLETTERRQYMLSLGRERPATYGAIEEAVRRYAPGLSLPGPPHYPRAESGL